MSGVLSLGIVTGSMSRNAGGLFNSVRLSAIHLQQAGVRVQIYALEDEHSAVDHGEWAPLEPIVLPRMLGRLPFAPRLAATLDSGDHDLIHLHGIWQPHSREVNRWKRKTGRPVMISPRGMLDPWALANSAWKKRLAGTAYEHRNLREADCLHALNASEAASMRAFGLTGPIAVIPNGAELPAIEPRPFKTSRKTLLFLGRIHPKKGLSELLDAWALASAARPELAAGWRLEIAGWDDGGHLADLEARIGGHGLADSVTISGPAFGEAKDALLRKADAFILPSYSEGLPMSVLEAWAYRLPVLMTKHCNLPEGFARSAGIEIPLEPRLLAESLVRALLEADLAPMGDAGRSLVEERYAWPRIARAHLDVYCWMISGGKAPACVERTNG